MVTFRAVSLPFWENFLLILSNIPLTKPLSMSIYLLLTTQSSAEKFVEPFCSGSGFRVVSGSQKP